MGAIGSWSVTHAYRIDWLQCGYRAADDEQNDFDAGPEEKRERFPGEVGSGVECAEFARLDCSADASSYSS